MTGVVPERSHFNSCNYLSFRFWATGLGGKQLEPQNGMTNDEADPSGGRSNLLLCYTLSILGTDGIEIIASHT